MDFEKGSKELEQIITKLESGQISLTEGIELFEKGSIIIKEAQEELNKAKGKVTVIKNSVEEPLE